MTKLPISQQPPIDPDLDLREEIQRLKKERNAVLLVHYYQLPEIQDLADFLGDSLYLARKAQETTADVICFAGVHFMAETAKIINPDKIVVLPDMEAGCSLATDCPVDDFVAWRKKFPDAVAVSYINSSAAVKAASNYVCTSSNAVQVVESIPRDKKILFAPDRNLGRYVQKQSGREMEIWPAACEVHENFVLEKVIQMQQEHPEAVFIAHPECEPPLLERAQFVGSTSALLRFVVESDAKEFIVGTEPGIIYEMKKRAPDKVFHEPPGHEDIRDCKVCNTCPYMKLNTLEKVYLALRDLQPRIEVDPELRRRALTPIERMLAIG